MKYILLFLYICHASSFACDNTIPYGDLGRAMNPPVSGKYLKCSDYPLEECVCWDNIDFWSADITTVNGKTVLVNNPTKAAAVKSARNKKEKDKTDKEKEKEDSVVALKAIKSELDAATNQAQIKAVLVKILKELSVIVDK